MRAMKLPAVLVFTVFLLLGRGNISTPNITKAVTPDNKTSDKVLKIVTTTSIIHDLVHEIAGYFADLRNGGYINAMKSNVKTIVDELE